VSTTLWLIPAFRSSARSFNMFFGAVIGRRAHWVAVPALAGSFLASCSLFSPWRRRLVHHDALQLDRRGRLRDRGERARRSAHRRHAAGGHGRGRAHPLYSIGYMHDDPGYARYFAYLNLFVFSMTMLVLAGNFLLLYVFWEAVGLCSYLLIGFWYTRQAAAAAARRRSSSTASATSASARRHVALDRAGHARLRGVFSGAATCTPARRPASRCSSSWARAASRRSSRCTSGCRTRWKARRRSRRSSTRRRWSPRASTWSRAATCSSSAAPAIDVVAWVGAATALFAATIGARADRHQARARVLDGEPARLHVRRRRLGAYAAGIFHLVTHAFFKALLFLGAGSVIHGLPASRICARWAACARGWCDDDHDARSARRARRPAGLSGFFSKDEILAAAFTSGHRG
jgi:NADH-quinone oxidoreductase subunit L